MNRIARVLCPVDFSEVSQHALDHAAAIARWYEARLTLLYVFANLPTMDLPPPALEDADRERLMSDLRRMAAAVARDVPVEFSVQEAGYVHEEILAQLGVTHADLLMIGTHGRSGFQRLFLGSVTEKVIRKTTRPTLVVPPRAPDVPAGSPLQFRRILRVVDPTLSANTEFNSFDKKPPEVSLRARVLYVTASEADCGGDRRLRRARRRAARWEVVTSLARPVRRWGGCHRAAPIRSPNRQ